MLLRSRQMQLHFRKVLSQLRKVILKENFHRFAINYLISLRMESANAQQQENFDAQKRSGRFLVFIGKYGKTKQRDME